MVPPDDEGLAELGADVGDGVRRRSGAVAEVGDDAVVLALLLEFPGFGDFCDGGIGGSPPLPRPLRIDLVSLRRVWARSCCPLDTRVNALVSISEVRSSMRRWTTLGCGGMGGELGQTDFLLFCDGVAGSIVMASREGRGRWVRVPSRRMSPQVRSA